MKLKSLLALVSVVVLTLSGCTDYAEDPFEPYIPIARIYVFTLEDGFITYEGFQSVTLERDTQNPNFPFELTTFSSGDSLIQELKHIPSAKVLASGYALPESDSPGQLHDIRSFSEYYEYYDDYYRKASRPEFDQVEIIGRPISETELDFPYMWGRLIKNSYFNRDMSSQNVRIGLAQFVPFSDSDDPNGSTFVFITYTY
ncbi:hypothetical protein BFP97_01575 [Roseivirga sp. 4D4]|uniref:hypothetical protein n=1 Tax=Roseivirga sp. 4D4 TaxID=1889784 RepID=UPI000853D025|nr:hypothetical protein [Roseivirga sp. 4D4]OEK00281.1 hypothetical protein BFP97_01575 [Roseivirga sp. 4D4]